ncbi:hypothetical protein V5O48_015126 [Marasmius crinis-equi]|uniref:F-box domain-containing protein n=1 Tax=Marasmius crinis-equi TaxID=585013 RepID=A0ABR3EVE5_9AGAR
MGTRGYVVHRYKRVRLNRYNHYDSYPSGLGLDLLKKIPKPSDGEGWQADFEKWLAKKRRKVEGMISEATKGLSPEQMDKLNVVDVDDYSLYFKGEPLNDDMIEWVYEMDLDNLCFLIDSCPVFKLDCMPDEDEFLDKIGFNNYGYRSFSPDETSEHRYVHNIIPYPSEEDPDTLQKYSQSCTSTASVHEILDIRTENLPITHQLRVRWVELMVSTDMASPDGMHYVDLKLEANGGENARDAMPPPSYEKLVNLAHQIFAPYVYASRVLDTSFRLLDGCPDVYVLRKDTVLCIYNHLDNPSSLHTGSYRLFKAIMDHWAAPVSQERFVYGVLFSGTRCVLVRVDRAEGKFTHTETMSFFPSWFAQSPSTEGITALARLACRIDPDVFDRFGTVKEPLAVETGLCRLDKLPKEILDQIAHCFDDFAGLNAYAHLSPRTRDASLKASSAYIFIKDFRLTAAMDRDHFERDGTGFEFDEIADSPTERNLKSALFRMESAKRKCVFCILASYLETRHRIAFDYIKVISEPEREELSVSHLARPRSFSLPYSALTLDGAQIESKRR